MAQTSGSISWWIALFPALLTSAAMFLAMWLVLRKRSWRDWKLLAKATAMPTEHVAAEPRTVRDLAVGEESYVDPFAIVTSKRGRRVFVAWDANLKDAAQGLNSQLAPLTNTEILHYGQAGGTNFAAVRLPWGWYAPVIEIVQAAPSTISETK